jgi:hypothetical protein
MPQQRRWFGLHTAPSPGSCSFYEESQWIRRLSFADLFPGWQQPWADPPKKTKQRGEEFIGSGTSTHIINVLISVTLLLIFLFYQSEESCFCSTLSSFCTQLIQLGLIYDNTINAMGKYIGEGPTLQLLSKGRVMIHVVALPLLAIPITEVATAHDIFSELTLSTVTKLVMLWASLEFLHWFNYDIKNLHLVDLRGSKDHKGAYLAGTLAYTSGKFFELVLPAILLVVYEMCIGCLILYNSSPEQAWSQAGIFLTISGAFTLAASAIPGRPDIQLYSENFHGGMIWVALHIWRH